MGSCFSRTGRRIYEANDIIDSSLSLRAKAIEEFVALAYREGNQMHALRNIIANDKSRAALMKFLQAEYCEENLIFIVVITCVFSVLISW